MWIFWDTNFKHLSRARILDSIDAESRAYTCEIAEAEQVL